MAEETKVATIALRCGCGESTVISMDESRARWMIDVGCLCRIELTEEAENDLSRGKVGRQRKLIEFVLVLLDERQRRAFDLYRDEVGGH